MDEEYRGGRSVDRYDRDRYGFRYGLVSFWNKVLGFFGFVLLCLIGLGIWTERQYLWVLGYLMLGAVVILVVLGLLAVCVAFMKWATAMRFFEVGQYGGYFQNWLGKLSPAAPLNPVAPKQGAASTQIDIAIPTLGELIRDGLLIQEQTMEILLGFRANGTARYGPWPKTFGVGGMGSSGKSVTMLLFIIIALLQGARVTVCDPHKTKTRSIYKKLEPLERWIRFAFTNEEILAASLEFSAELKARKDGAKLPPRLMVYDELTSIIKRTPEISKQVTQVVSEGNQEGMGYDMYVMIACHEWDKDALGDVAVRQALNAAFVHRLDPGQSKFLISDKKIARKTENLKPGHAYYKDEFGEIEYLIMPHGTVKDAAEVAKILGQMDSEGLLSAAQIFPALPQKAATMPTVRNVPNTPPLREREDMSMAAPPPMPDFEEFVSHVGNAVSERETAVEADTRIIENVFPISQMGTRESISRGNSMTAFVSVEIRETIKRMHKAKMPMRDVANLVGLAGRKYHILQEVYREEGLIVEQEA